MCTHERSKQVQEQWLKFVIVSISAVIQLHYLIPAATLLDPRIPFLSQGSTLKGFIRSLVFMWGDSQYVFWFWCSWSSCVNHKKLAWSLSPESTRYCSFQSNYPRINNFLKKMYAQASIYVRRNYLYFEL